MTRGHFGLPLLLCLLVWLAAGCGREQTGPVVVSFWAMGREGDAVALLLPEFEREHPDIRVELQRVPWTAAHAKLLTAFAGNSLPDIFQLGNTWIPEMAALGALAPLSQRTSQSAATPVHDYFPGIWQTNVVDGDQYGVPWYVDTRLLFYRRDLLAAAGFDGPPQTWEEWRQVLAAVETPFGRGRHTILLPTDEFEQLLVLGLQQDDALLRDDGRYGNFRSAGFQRALKFYLEMFERDRAPLMSRAQVSNIWSEFARGNFAFFISGPWNVGELRKRLPPERQDIWMTAPVPGPDGPGASTAGGSSLVLFAGSKRQDAAWKLVEFLSRPAIQQRFHALTGNLPPRRSAWADPQLAGDVKMRAFLDQLERARPAPKVPEWERIANEMQHVAAGSVYGRYGADDAVLEIDRRVDAILAKRRSVLKSSDGALRQ